MELADDLPMISYYDEWSQGLVLATALPPFWKQYLPMTLRP